MRAVFGHLGMAGYGFGRGERFGALVLRRRMKVVGRVVVVSVGARRGSNVVAARVVCRKVVGNLAAAQ